jgi:hypothetical protein
VHVGSSHSGAFAALALAVMLSGCASVDVFDTSEGWFTRRADWFGRGGGFTFSELQESRKERPITANDLVDANGACAAPAAQPAATASADPNAGPPVSPDASSLLGGGISLGMSECDVVYRAGQPSNVQLGRNDNGGRTAVLTINGGPRAGIYRFEDGRLMQLDAVEQPPSVPTVVKKKPLKRNKHKQDDAA